MLQYLDKKNRRVVTLDWSNLLTKFEIYKDLFFVRKLNDFTIDGIYLESSGKNDEYYRPMYYITPLFDSQIGMFNICNYVKDRCGIAESVRMVFHKEKYLDVYNSLVSQNSFVSEDNINGDTLIAYWKHCLLTHNHISGFNVLLFDIAYMLVYLKKPDIDKYNFEKFIDDYAMNNPSIEKYANEPSFRLRIKNILYSEIAKRDLEILILKNIPKGLR